MIREFSSGWTMASINEIDVRQALRAMCNGTSHCSHLHDLQLVDDMLDRPTFPGSKQSREYALNRILTTIILDQLTYQRVALNHKPPTSDETRKAALTAIRDDGLSGSLELLSWSWLYYHFVRVELYITAEDFCTQLGITPRTLRRYQRRGIKRLTAHLIEVEQTARISQRFHKPTT